MLWKFIALNLVHYICDYPLQNAFLREWKAKNNYVLFVHSFIWAAGVAALLQYFGMYALWKFLMLLVGHFLMDGWKCRGHHKRMGIRDLAAFSIDQTSHAGQLPVCLLC